MNNFLFNKQDMSEKVIIFSFFILMNILFLSHVKRDAGATPSFEMLISSDPPHVVKHRACRPHIIVHSTSAAQRYKDAINEALNITRKASGLNFSSSSAMSAEFYNEDACEIHLILTGNEIDYFTDALAIRDEAKANLIRASKPKSLSTQIGSLKSFCQLYEGPILHKQMNDKNYFFPSYSIIHVNSLHMSNNQIKGCILQRLGNGIFFINDRYIRPSGGPRGGGGTRTVFNTYFDDYPFVKFTTGDISLMRFVVNHPQIAGMNHNEVSQYSIGLNK